MNDIYLSLIYLIIPNKQGSPVMISGQSHIHLGQSGTKEAMRQKLLAMRCVP